MLDNRELILDAAMCDTSGGHRLAGGCSLNWVGASAQRTPAPGSGSRCGTGCMSRARIARVMAISVHPSISCVPHWIGYLERLYADIKAQPGVAFWTWERILDWYWTQVFPPR